MTREEAIETVRRCYPRISDGECDFEIAMRVLVPELAESEDERIRKKCIEIIKRVIPNGDSKSQESKEILDCIAYLEKQKENSLGKYSEEENLAYRLNWVMQDYYKAGKDDEEREHRFKCYRLFLDALEDEKFFEPKKQKPFMIQWKGDNLKEVIDFTGKSPMFDKWFKSFEEYEEYVHSHGNIFKLFNEDGAHYEVPVGAWIVKTPDGCNVASKAAFRQKPAEWNEEDEEMLSGFLHKLEVCNLLSNKENAWIVRKLKSIHHQPKPEAEGDNETETQKAYREGKNAGRKEVFGHPEYYGLQPRRNPVWSDEDEKRIKQLIYDTEHIRAEYEERKKELGESFNDKLIKDCDEQIAWLKSLLENIKKKNEDVAKLCSNEWSEEDKKTLNAIISVLREIKSQPLKRLEDWDGYINFLESIRPHWKPSKEQMYILNWVANILLNHDGIVEEEASKKLQSLYNQLKKL